jgi:hypothetical protein
MKFQIIGVLLFVQVLTFGQKQVHIDWPSIANSPWPILRGDMQGTGRSTYIGPSTSHIKWIKDMPLGIIWGPVIGYNDVLYMGERAITYDSLNYFFAVSKESSELWNFRTPTYFPNYGGPILLRDSSIYFISGNNYLYALDKYGKMKWSTYLGQYCYLQYPLDKKGNLYVPRQDTLRIISPEGSIRKIYFPQITHTLSFSTGGDTIYVITGGPMGQELPGTLTAAGLEGKIYWTFPLGGVRWGIPLVDNQNNIYFFGSDTLWANQDYLYCLKPDGTLRWKYRVNFTEDGYSPSMDKDGNIVIFNTAYIDSVQRGIIVSLDYNGHTRWTAVLPGDASANYVSCGVVCDAEGKTYFGSMRPGGNFYCIDSNGKILWTLPLNYEYDSCPAIGSDGTLYIGTHGSSFFTNHIQNLIAIKDTLTSVSDENVKVIEFKLNQNYPNPFNPATTISYSLPSASNVKIVIYNTLGQSIKVLENGYRSAGNYSVNFNASDLPSGIYFYRLEAGLFSHVMKMMLLK